MYSVDFPLSHLLRSSSRLAGFAIALTLVAGFGGVSMPEANASSESLRKVGGNLSISSSYTRSRHVSRRKAGRHYGQHKRRGHQRRYKHTKYRNHRHQYKDYHRSNYAGRLFINRSLKDVRSSGVSLGHRNYRVRTHNYGPVGLVITNQNGVRVISNYGRSYDNQYNPSPTINGISIDEKCPLNFQCGLRAYDDNSGPRIIRLGKGANADIDKIGPPKVITYPNGIN
ncbi:MAG: hypothetical protein QM488_04020 [Rhizobiaceae bacterium]